MYYAYKTILKRPTNHIHTNVVDVFIRYFTCWDNNEKFDGRGPYDVTHEKGEEFEDLFPDASYCHRKRVVISFT